jgi:ubiquinone/menaquinone biosynthesis C-methylase UbiE
MTWEEIIIDIRKQDKYKDLIKNCYLEEDLVKNVKAFHRSEEFKLTEALIKKHSLIKNPKSIIDIGAGNGIATLAFSIEGYKVTALDPDPSRTVGIEAIKWVAGEMGRDISIINSYAEKIPIADDTFDIVYVRQAMHHANNLELFLLELSRILKPNGLLLCIRDHVIYDKKDKAKFFKAHPLHKFYGGENAFTQKEYSSALLKANFSTKEVFKFFESPINYFPFTISEVNALKEGDSELLYRPLSKKLGVIGSLPLVRKLFDLVKGNPKWNGTTDERRFSCRMYSFISIKNA